MIIIFGWTALYAQTGTITGSVVDANTQRPLIGTNILVMDTQLGAATDLQGRFTIENVPVGTIQLRFTYIGYETLLRTDIVVKSRGTVTINAEMVPSVVFSEGVTVTAGYFSKEERVEPSTIALSREEIRRFPGGFEDVVRTVSTLPGVAINMTAGRNDLLVRGGGPSENLYLINNIEVPNINHFGTPGNTGGSLSFVNLDFVDDVTFSTGGFGARYGDKMSSVIALTMANNRPAGLETKWTLSATQFGADAEMPLGRNGSLVLSARKSYLDLIFKAAGQPFVPVYTDFNVLLNYDITDKDKLFFLALSAIDNIDRDQSTLENRVTNAGLMDNTQYKGISGVNYRRLLSKGVLDVTFGVNIQKYELSQLNENEEIYFTSDADEWETSLKIQNLWSFSKKANLTTGISTKWISNENTTVFADTIYDRSGNRIPVAELGLSPRNEVDMRAQKSALYTEFNWKPWNKMDLTIGMRADHYDFIQDPWAVAPRLSVKYLLHPRHAIRLSGGTYYQAPSYNWVVNPNNVGLKPLKNNMGVLGWDFLIQDDLRLSIEGYTKTYSDLPTGTIPGVYDHIVITNTGTSYGGREDDFSSFGYFDLVSDGTGKSYGVDLVLQKKYAGIPLYGLFSISYNKTEVVAGDGGTYPGQYDQRWIVNVSGGYIFNDKWEVSAKFRYFTGVPYTPVYRPSANPLQPGTIQNLPEEYLTERLKPGHHLDIRVERYFNLRKLALIVYVDIQNIYNFKIPMKPDYDFWEDTIETSSSIGILPSIGISLEI